MQALPDALARRLPAGRLNLNCEVRRVHLKEKIAEIGGLGEVRYKRLVNTLPLPAFLDIAAPLPQAARRARAKLKWNTVYNLNLGVSGRVSDKHWIYFPEGRFPFYRVGFPSNFSAHAAPPGASSMYVEVSRRPEERVDMVRLESGIMAGLRACGLLKPSNKILTKKWIVIPCAYVIYDFERTPAVNAIFSFLKSAGVESIGRYGAWKYSFMEETILDGKRCAERLLGIKPSETPASQVELKPLR